MEAVRNNGANVTANSKAAYQNVHYSGRPHAIYMGAQDTLKEMAEM